MNSPLVGLIGYLIIIAGIGTWTWRLNRTKEDFIIGSRRLGAWVIAFSERTAAESAWLILGLSGALFSIGMLEIWTVIGCVAGIIASWMLVARRLRQVTEEYGAITLPQYFFKVSGRQGQAVRVISMIIITFFFSFYVAAQFLGAGKTLHVTFGLDQSVGMPLAAVVVVLYTMMGGFCAVCYTDVIQGIVMLITLFIMPILGLFYLSSHGLDAFTALHAAADKASLLGGKTGWPALAAVIGGLSWGFGYCGQPHLVTKFMAINKPEAVRTSRAVAITWTVIAYTGACLVGLVGIALVYHGQFSGETIVSLEADPERILPVMASFLFPAWFAGILISGAVAAMMSTADSQLLVTTSTVVEDFYSRALRREVSQRRLVTMSRLVTIAVGLVAYFLAVSSGDLIYDVVSLAWSGLGASFGPAILLTLYWRRMNGAGIVAAMVTGAVSTAIWKWTPGLDAALSVRFVSFVLAALAGIIGATATGGRADRPQGEAR
ncbi:sodium/proline symporter [Candidatus Fermentibacteria bacterium]|nr:sodium/proline symporter [Candidatus Fermentibacteria bacterium]